MNDFDALLAELAPLAKAMAAPEGDDKVKAAAAEAGNKPEETEEEGSDASGGGATEEGGAEDEDVMGKSFSVTMEDGSVVEAYDGTAMMKAMGVELAALRTVGTEQAAELVTAKAELAKALTASAGLLGLVKQQGELLKSLSADVAKFGSQGTGRRAAVTVMDKPGAIETAPAAPAGATVMAKAMTAYEAGTFTASDIARLESHLGRGNPAPADLVARLPA